MKVWNTVSMWTLNVLEPYSDFPKCLSDVLDMPCLHFANSSRGEGGGAGGGIRNAEIRTNAEDVSTCSAKVFRKKILFFHFSFDKNSKFIL